MNSITTIEYLSINIIIDEVKCVDYLKSKNLLSNNYLVYLKKNTSTKCGGNYTKQQEPVKTN